MYHVDCYFDLHRNIVNDALYKYMHTQKFQDTAGGEEYESMSRIYYRGAKAAIVCYDLTDHTSFEKAHFWVNELKTNEEVETITVIFFLYV